MKSKWFLWVTAVLIFLGITACAKQSNPDKVDVGIHGPALIVFYTDN
ncbi:MAG: hypothetical protein KA362_17375 [Chloroflexi bacterium]|nr:hypothetical protein [Chloroflexota bacterium]MBK8935534.1 hypothetical protein [Chloroflexota bacterium]MBP6805885.1 hypothetical protein [Chloroflexota bacterium]MBP7591722.1 hypothetical protein [Chloroflexota bacterium]